MFDLKSGALFLAVLCFVQLHQGNGTVQESRGSQLNEGDFLFIGRKSFDNDNLIFAVCHSTVPNAKECRIIQKVYPKKGNAHACNITLKGDHEDSKLDFSLGVATLGKDKAILYWAEVYNNSSVTKIATVNLETCKMNIVKIEDPNRNFITELQMTDKIVAHNDDSFDIFVNDPKRFGDKLGKVAVNTDGTAKNEPTATNIKAGLIYDLPPIATRSSAKGYAALRVMENNNILPTTLSLIKPDGSERALEIYNKTSRPTYSAGENVLNSCNEASAETDVTCKQYDEDGNVKYTTTIVDANKNIYPMATHNLPGGGMLVLLVEEGKCDDNSTCSKFRIVKIAADGKILGTARSDVFEKTSSEYTYAFVYKFGDSEYCAAIIGANPTIVKKREDDYEMLQHCVTEDEFEA